jgi:hypothetical protein
VSSDIRLPEENINSLITTVRELSGENSVLINGVQARITDRQWGPDKPRSDIAAYLILSQQNVCFGGNLMTTSMPFAACFLLLALGTFLVVILEMVKIFL